MTFSLNLHHYLLGWFGGNFTEKLRGIHTVKCGVTWSKGKVSLNTRGTDPPPQVNPGQDTLYSAQNLSHRAGRQVNLGQTES